MYGFNTDDVKYSGQSLPIGMHKVMVTGEEIKESQNPNNPKYLSVKLEIVEGEYKGKSYNYFYNLFNKNEDAVRIAREQLKRIGDATGQSVSDDQPLKNRVFVIQVRAQKNDAERTEIFKYLPEDTALVDTTPPLA